MYNFIKYTINVDSLRDIYDSLRDIYEREVTLEEADNEQSNLVIELMV